LIAQNRFNVVAFHGESSGWSSVPLWVVRGSDEVIGGVVLERGSIIPLYCDACDANPVYRWIGSEYVLNAHLVGESACVDSGALLYEKPDLVSAFVQPTTKVGWALVVEIGASSYEYRWYKIKLINEDGREGFVQSRHFLEDPGSCG
jgi:hypothetical protein